MASSEELTTQQDPIDIASFPPPKKIAKFRQTTINFGSKSKSTGTGSESEKKDDDTSFSVTSVYSSQLCDSSHNNSESNLLKESWDDEQHPSGTSVNTLKTVDQDSGTSFNYDIGHFVSKKANDLEKSHMLLSKWQPCPGFKWPYAMKNQGGNQYKRSLKRSHIDQFPDFAYSEMAGGAVLQVLCTC